MSNRKTKKQMVRGNRTDEIGRLDHTRASDNRAKNKRDFLKEVDDENEAQLQEDISFLRHAMFGD
jgi:hypothetical protein